MLRRILTYHRESGINIVVFHLWKLLKGHFAVPQLLPRQIGIPLTWGFNFVLCVIGIALFRAGSLSNAFTLISTLTLQQGAFVDTSLDIGLIHKIPEFALGLVLAVLATLAMTLVLPNLVGMRPARCLCSRCTCLRTVLLRVKVRGQ